jgi:hypothetical protein
MPKTLEKYQKCSYAGPETTLQNRENEVCPFPVSNSDMIYADTQISKYT